MQADARAGICRAQLTGCGGGTYFHDFPPVTVAPFAALRPISAIPVALVGGLCKIFFGGEGKELLPLNTNPFGGFCCSFPHPSRAACHVHLDRHVILVGRRSRFARSLKHLQTASCLAHLPPIPSGLLAPQTGSPRSGVRLRSDLNEPLPRMRSKSSLITCLAT